MTIYVIVQYCYADEGSGTMLRSDRAYTSREDAQYAIIELEERLPLHFRTFDIEELTLNV